MSQPSIFISHSAKEPSAKALLDCLHDALRNAGFNAFVADRKMLRGADYKKKLYHELLTCYGAIVLLSPGALRSTWVHREVTVLVGRHSEEEAAFPLLPVLIAGTTRDAVKKSPLGDLNILDLHAPRTGANEAASEITGMLKDLYGPPGPLHDLEVTIANMLSRADIDALKLVAEVLNVDLTRWQPHGNRLAVSREMLRADQATFAKAMMKIGGVVENPVGVIDLVFPFTWIDEQSAAPLREAARTVSPRPSLALNSARNRTGRWYVRRACPEPFSWSVAEPLGPEAESYDQALEEEVRRTLLEILGYGWDEDVSAADLDDALDTYEQEYGPIFVLLPALADEVTMATLRQGFPRLVFFILLGDANEGQPVPDGVRMLTPLLDAKAEGDSHRNYRILRRQFERPASAAIGGRRSADG